jgi:hypothetical protein
MHVAPWAPRGCQVSRYFPTLSIRFHHDPPIIFRFSMHSPPIFHPKDALSATKTTLQNEIIHLSILQDKNTNYTVPCTLYCIIHSRNR